MTETIKTLAKIELEDRFVSKVQGRRNWVIYCCDGTAKLYGFGQACRRGIMQCRLSDISKYKIHWLHFTYKKDALEVLELLGKNGYVIL